MSGAASIAASKRRRSAGAGTGNMQLSSSSIQPLNKNNNKVSNLAIVTPTEHDRIHEEENKSTAPPGA